MQRHCLYLLLRARFDYHTIHRGGVRLPEFAGRGKLVFAFSELHEYKNSLQHSLPS